MARIADDTASRRARRTHAVGSALVVAAIGAGVVGLCVLLAGIVALVSGDEQTATILFVALGVLGMTLGITTLLRGIRRPTGGWPTVHERTVPRRTGRAPDDPGASG